MAKILFVSIPEKGHLNPMIAPAQALRKAGAEVFFWTYFHPGAQLDALDFPYFFEQNNHSGFVTKGAEFVEKLKNAQWLFDWIKTLLIDAAEPQAEALEALIHKTKPDLIVSDPMVYATPIASRRTGIPWVGISNSLNPVTPPDADCLLTQTLRALHSQRVELFEKYGIKNPVFTVSDAVSPFLNVVFTCREYAGEYSYDKNLIFAGPAFEKNMLRGDASGLDTEIPPADVYMSLGSQIYYHPAWFLKVAGVLKKMRLTGIFAVNELMDDSDFVARMPTNIKLLRYAPQLQILPKVRCVITHGGANTVNESLAFGLPALMSPVCNDQFLQAIFIEKNRTGRVINPETEDAGIIEHHLVSVLSDHNEYAANAQKMSSLLWKAKEDANLVNKILSVIQEV